MADKLEARPKLTPAGSPGIGLEVEPTVRLLSTGDHYLEPGRFNSLARALSAILTRRGIVRLLTGMALVGPRDRTASDEVAAAVRDCSSGVSCAHGGWGEAIQDSGDHTHPAQSPDCWEVAFDDTFDGTELVAGTWQTQFPWGRDRSRVGELQWYAPDNLEHADSFQVADGRLRIVADRCAAPTDIGHEFCSGLISTHHSFAQEYGYFEIRARVPVGQGLWPAFWLLPVDTSWPPEIDVFEFRGHEPNTVHMNVHYADVDDENQEIPGEFTGPDFSQDYHTFAIDWNPERIVWYVDGVERHRVEYSEAIPAGLFFVIANLAVGGTWPGDPDETTTFPAYFDIDYIRVYRRRSADTCGRW
jgi:beta-glucanase (GH16 family)